MLLRHEVENDVTGANVIAQVYSTRIPRILCSSAEERAISSYGTRKDSRNQPYFATACWEPGMAPPPLSHSTPVTSSNTPDIFAIPYFVSNETTEVSQLVSYFTDTNFSGC